MASTARLGRQRDCTGFLEHHKVIGSILTLAVLVGVGIASGRLIGVLLAHLLNAGRGVVLGGS